MLNKLLQSYCDAGFKLILVSPRGKNPARKCWNEAGQWLNGNDMHLAERGYNVGLGHLWSSTCAIDIDDLDKSKRWFFDCGISLDELLNHPDAVVIERDGTTRCKLIYKIDYQQYPLKTLIVKSTLEFRSFTSATKTVQDVLPPSIHPDGSTYRWKGDFRNLPDIPPELLEVWESRLAGQHRDKNVVIDRNAVKTNIVEIRNALSFITPNCDYQTWLNIGMALHNYSYQRGLALWDEWSSLSFKYPGRDVLIEKWKSFGSHRNPITINSLFHIARQTGYHIDLSYAFIKKNETTSYDEVLNGKPVSHNLESLPPVIFTVSNQIAASVGCAQIIPALACITAISGLIDARSRLVITPTYVVPPIVWTMIIGDPGSKKTPGSRPIFKIVEEIQKNEFETYAESLTNYNIANDIYKNQYEQYIRELKDVRDMELIVKSPVNPPIENVKPIAPTLICTDLTSQVMAVLAAERPEGLLVLMDDMAGWLKKITFRQSSDDRSTWLASYEAQQYQVHRVKSEGTVLADNFAFTVYGNAQPRLLHNYFDDLHNDGLLQRFMLFRINPTCKIPDATITPDLEPLSLLLNNIRQTPYADYKLSESAQRCWDQFKFDLDFLKKSYVDLNTDSVFMTALAKVEGLCARLALIFHFANSPGYLTNTLSESTIIRAITFINDVVIPSLKQAYTLKDTASNADIIVITWLINNTVKRSCKTIIKTSNIYKSVYPQLNKLMNQDRDIVKYMNIINQSINGLVKHGWVRKVKETALSLKTRLRSPDLLIKYNENYYYTRDGKILLNEQYEIRKIAIQKVNEEMQGNEEDEDEETQE